MRTWSLLRADVLELCAHTEDLHMHCRLVTLLAEICVRIKLFFCPVQ